MNRLEKFKDFYIRVVLLNRFPSFRYVINESNFDDKMATFIEKFEESYGFNPFDEQILLEDFNVNSKNDAFIKYSKSVALGVPGAILDIYKRFLAHQGKVYFERLQELIDKIHTEFKEDLFIDEFHEERLKLNGKSSVRDKKNLFRSAEKEPNHDWAFNKGSTKELQYHLLNRAEGFFHYGLKFSAYSEQHNTEPLKEVQPFIDSYFINKLKIKTLLNDYSLYIDNRNTDIKPSTEEELKNIKKEEGFLLGKAIALGKEGDKLYMDGSKFLEMIYDMEYKQFKAYKLIYQNANLIKMNEITTKKEMRKYIELLRYKHQIILQGPPGTGKTREAKEIAKELLGLNTEASLEGNEQFKLIQFHPSYSYEDFVRGIVAESKDNTIQYKTEDKVLAKFAKEAQKAINRPIKWEDFRDFLENEKEEGRLVYFDEENRYNEIKEEIKESNIIKLLCYSHKEKSNNWRDTYTGIPFEEFNQKNLDNNFVDFKNRQIIKNGYWNAITDYFTKWAKDFKSKPKPYVLVIDEINRANLSAVLGELIYALEYRGEAVESMYAWDDTEEGKKLILPPNLYIIGTMNTADRSVGHIDYAIRRRFAFVEVLPKVLEKDFDENLFKAVSGLFIENYDEYVNNPTVVLKSAKTLCSEFKPQDVWLGQSYFISKDKQGNTTPTFIRWEYEIKPILLEYVKDGILTDVEKKMQEIEKIAYENNAL